MATSFKDLIPLRERADAGDIEIERPSPEEVTRQTERTKNALANLISGASTAQKPQVVQKHDDQVTYVKYKPEQPESRERLIKVQSARRDPMEPPKHKVKKIPHGPPSPPRPILRSPPRKAGAEEQAAWRLPPAVSSWKNPKGYTKGIHKLLVARPVLEDVTIIRLLDLTK
ncbi:mRNA splicing protein [Thelotrema lepadinum]|nr:mRNA splicing protein [Thelotrema lepadinum]